METLIAAGLSGWRLCGSTGVNLRLWGVRSRVTRMPATPKLRCREFVQAKARRRRAAGKCKPRICARFTIAVILASSDRARRIEAASGTGSGKALLEGWNMAGTTRGLHLAIGEPSDKSTCWAPYGRLCPS
jgi:hypothetical protein